MATTASSAPNSSSHTTPYSINSAMSRSRRPPSPWTQIVSGGDPDVIQDDPVPSVSASLIDEDPSFQPVSPSVSPPIDKDTPDNDNAGKKPAWNKPSNCSPDVGSVMGAESWPALSVSARVSSIKSVSSESLKGLSDGSSSMPPPQAVDTPSASTQKQSGGSDSALSQSDPNVSALSQKKPFKRSNSNSTISNPSAPANVTTPPLNTIPSTHTQRSGSYGGGNSQHRNSYRNRNGGSYTRGDSVHHQSHGHRRNYDHVNHSAYAHRNYSGRDVQMQPQQGFGFVTSQMLMGPPSFPVGNAQYIAGPPLRPYSGPMLYSEYPASIYIPHPTPESMALAGQFSPQPIYVSAYDTMLFTKIVNQVDFYFSADNLSKDKYLRQQMDNEGWVPVSLIAGFRKLAELTNNVQIILDALKSSAVVEVQGESIRRRGDWNKYLWPRDLQDPTVSMAGSAAAAAAAAVKEDETVEAHLQEMKVSDGRDEVQEDSSK